MTSLKRNDHIDYLKAFAAVLVVLHHALEFSRADRSAFWAMIVALVSSVHVPLFFVIAGYLCHRQNSRCFLKKKAFRVLLPFVTFSALKLIYTTFVSGEFSHASTFRMQLFDAFVLGKLYWFPYGIFLSYVLAMLFWTDRDASVSTGQKRAGIIAFFVLAVTNMLVDFTDIPVLALFQIGKTLSHFCFFLTGMLIYRYQENLIASEKRYRHLIGAACAIVAAVICFLLYSDRVDHTFAVKFLLAFSVMYLLWAAFRKLPQGIRPLKTMGRYSLQIMFFDSFFKILVFAVLRPLVPGRPVLAILSVVLNITCTCLTCMILEKIPYVRRAFGL